MAITPLGADEYGFTFNGTNSKTYGVYITDGAFYSAPVRDTTKIEIPGRNGAFLQDHGRFKNIQVTYRCTLYAENAADFISAMADVRAWLCSVKGYAKLFDDFNPDEYRKASFVDGVGVTNIRPEVGTFDVNFEAMPQRFLDSGDTKKTIAVSGDTITNPTKFPSRPLLEVNGYGKIGINGEEIEIQNGNLGEVLLLSSSSKTNAGGFISSVTLTPDYSAMNVGDPVEIRGICGFYGTGVGLYSDYDNFTQSSGAAFGNPYGQWSEFGFQLMSGFGFNLGTARSEWAQAEFEYTAGGISKLMTLKASITVNTSGVITLALSIQGWSLGDDTLNAFKFTSGNIYGDSSQSVLGNPLYLDLDIGEAYKIVSDEIVSVNNGVFLGAELPELKPGANTITFDNTVTTLKIVPRWWAV